MATLQAHGGAIATAVKTTTTDASTPDKERTRETRSTAALCQDGAVLAKTESRTVGPGAASWERRWRGGGYRLSIKPGGSDPESFGRLQDSWGAGTPPKPTANSRYVMASNGFRSPESAAGPKATLESIAAAYAAHAPLSVGFNRDPCPGPAPGLKWTQEPGLIQSTQGGDLPAVGMGGGTYPKGLDPGPFYPAATLLTGRLSDGEPAAHADLEAHAAAFFGDPGGMRATWEYDGSRWVAAFMARCSEMDPAHLHRHDRTGKIAARLRALLSRLDGGAFEPIGDGAHFYATAIRRATGGA